MLTIPDPLGAYTLESSSAATCAMPGVCTASGGKDSSTSRRASSRAMIACLGFADHILITRNNAPTLSPRIFSTTRDCDHSFAHMSMATRIAKHSHNCCPVHDPSSFSSKVRASSTDSLQAKNFLMVPSIESQPPIPQGDASVPISTIGPVLLYASVLKNRSIRLPPSVKKAWNHRSVTIICFAHTVFFGAPLLSWKYNAAHKGSMKGRMIINRPENVSQLPHQRVQILVRNNVVGH